MLLKMLVIAGLCGYVTNAIAMMPNQRVMAPGPEHVVLVPVDPNYPLGQVRPATPAEIAEIIAVADQPPVGHAHQGVRRALFADPVPAPQAAEDDEPAE